MTDGCWQMSSTELCTGYKNLIARLALGDYAFDTYSPNGTGLTFMYGTARLTGTNTVPCRIFHKKIPKPILVKSDSNVRIELGEGYSDFYGNIDNDDSEFDFVIGGAM